MSDLEQNLIDWFQHPAVQARRWAPALFWHETNDGQPFGVLRVDPRELEVLFASIIGVPSLYREPLDRERNGRGSFLAINAGRHELPLLSRREP
jgi:hypothetical protein